jgi:hypothetical protein
MKWFSVVLIVKSLKKEEVKKLNLNLLTEYTNTKVNDQNHLENLLEESNLDKFINHQTNLKELESKYDYFKGFHFRNNQLYSYSPDLINKFFNKKVLNKNCRMSSYTINLIINIVDKPSLLNYFPELVN